MPMAVGIVVIFKFFPIYIKIEWEAAKHGNPIVVAPKLWFPLFLEWYNNGTLENYFNVFKNYGTLLNDGVKFMNDPEDREFKILCCCWLWIPGFVLWVFAIPFVVVGPIVFYFGWLFVIIVIPPWFYVGAIVSLDIILHVKKNVTFLSFDLFSEEKLLTLEANHSKNCGVPLFFLTDGHP